MMGYIYTLVSAEELAADDGPSIVCGNFDEAAVNMDVRNGVRVKLVNDHPCAIIIR